MGTLVWLGALVAMAAPADRIRVAFSQRQHAAERPVATPQMGHWRRFESIADQAREKLSLVLNQTSFRPGQNLVLTVTAPRDGYLNIINIAAGEPQAVVVFPNQFAAQNRVRAGQKLVIPDAGQNWTLPASLPSGLAQQKNLFVAICSDFDLNYHRQGAGAGPFKSLNVDDLENAIRSLKATAGGYAAGKAQADIRR